MQPSETFLSWSKQALRTPNNITSLILVNTCGVGNVLRSYSTTNIYLLFHKRKIPHWKTVTQQYSLFNLNSWLCCLSNNTKYKILFGLQQIPNMAGDQFNLGLLDDDDYKVSVLRTKLLGIGECFMYRLPKGSQSPYRYVGPILRLEFFLRQTFGCSPNFCFLTLVALFHQLCLRNRQSRWVAIDETTSVRIATSGKTRRRFVAHCHVHARRCRTKESAEIVCLVPNRYSESIG